jgi:hypothetical protein
MAARIGISSYLPAAAGAADTSRNRSMSPIRADAPS